MPNHEDNASSVSQLNIPFDAAVWWEQLQGHQLQTVINNYIIRGVPVGYEGMSSDTPVIYGNWQSVYNHRDAVWKSIKEDTALGHKLGPFMAPPHSSFIGSPMGAFVKKRSMKLRVVHDLSWPPGKSVNHHIDSAKYTVSYSSVADAAQLVYRCGQGAYMAKLDLESAYRQVRVRQEDWGLLGSSWTDTDGKVSYYMDTVLPFGLRSAPKIFNDFATALHEIMVRRGAVNVVHYLDDFFTCSSSKYECEKSLKIMLEVCDMCSFPINVNKLIKPTTQLEFLGIVIDSVDMCTKISVERMQEIYSILFEWIGKTKCTKRQLLSLIGKLNYVSMVVSTGRTYLRRLIEASKSAKYLHQIVFLSNDAKCDILWWLNHLCIWNGVSIIPEPDWLENEMIHFYTDASDVAVAGVFGKSWFTQELSNSVRSMNIAGREMLAFLKAVITWRKALQGVKLVIHCDNQVVVQAINTGLSRDKNVMVFVRLLHLIIASLNFQCKAVYISTYNNVLADALSRLQFEKFFDLCPDADVCMTMPADIYFDGKVM